MLTNSLFDNRLLLFIQFLERLPLTRLRDLELQIDVHHREETLEFPLDFQRLNPVRDNELHLLENLIVFLRNAAQINLVYLLHYLILLELHLIEIIMKIYTLAFEVLAPELHRNEILAELFSLLKLVELIVEGMSVMFFFLLQSP